MLCSRMHCSLGGWSTWSSTAPLHESLWELFCDVQELAWATFALLRNTNASGVLLWADGRTLAARGQLRRQMEGSDSLLDDSGAVSLCTCALTSDTDASPEPQATVDITWMIMRKLCFMAMG